mmetsp:Transcript_47213/g.133137  ORF Transcript_47213/g.133137 Transcript_47213/m.133137 type:complete len:211 (+) Transcript_47213:59-691(+)
MPWHTFPLHRRLLYMYSVRWLEKRSKPVRDALSQIVTTPLAKYVHCMPPALQRLLTRPLKGGEHQPWPPSAPLPRSCASRGKLGMLVGVEQIWQVGRGDKDNIAVTGWVGLYACAAVLTIWDDRVQDADYILCTRCVTIFQLNGSVVSVLFCICRGDHSVLECLRDTGTWKARLEGQKDICVVRSVPDLGELRGTSVPLGGLLRPVKNST